MDEEWRIRFRWTLAFEDEPTTLTEYCFAWILTIARHGCCTLLTPLRLELVQPRTHAKLLERHFGCPTQNAIIFRAVDIDCPFVTRNAELLEMLAPQYREQRMSPLSRICLDYRPHSLS